MRPSTTNPAPEDRIAELRARLRDLADEAADVERRMKAVARADRDAVREAERLIAAEPEQFAYVAAGASDEADAAIVKLLAALDEVANAVSRSESAWRPLMLGVGLGSMDDPRSTTNRRLPELREPIEAIRTRPDHLRPDDDLRDLRLVTWSVGTAERVETYPADHSVAERLNVLSDTFVVRGEPVLPKGAPPLRRGTAR